MMHVTFVNSEDLEEDVDTEGFMHFQPDETLITEHNIRCVMDVLRAVRADGDISYDEAKTQWLVPLRQVIVFTGHSENDLEALWAAGVQRMGGFKVH